MKKAFAARTLQVTGENTKLFKQHSINPFGIYYEAKKKHNNHQYFLLGSKLVCSVPYENSHGNYPQIVKNESFPFSFTHECTHLTNFNRDYSVT